MKDVASRKVTIVIIMALHTLRGSCPQSGVLVQRHMRWNHKSYDRYSTVAAKVSSVIVTI